jgi:hypothetical protein
MLHGCMLSGATAAVSKQQPLLQGAPPRTPAGGRWSLLRQQLTTPPRTWVSDRYAARTCGARPGETALANGIAVLSACPAASPSGSRHFKLSAARLAWLKSGARASADQTPDAWDAPCGNVPSLLACCTCAVACWPYCNRCAVGMDLLWCIATRVAPCKPCNHAAVA